MPKRLLIGLPGLPGQSVESFSATALREGDSPAEKRLPIDIVQLITDIDAFVWGPPMIVILLGSHLFLTFRTGFIQRKLPTAIKLSVTKDPDAPGDISQFGALCTAL